MHAMPGNVIFATTDDAKAVARWLDSMKSSNAQEEEYLVILQFTCECT